jgi:hypothetical protein
MKFHRKMFYSEIFEAGPAAGGQAEKFLLGFDFLQFPAFAETNKAKASFYKLEDRVLRDRSKVEVPSIGIEAKWRRGSTGKK